MRTSRLTRPTIRRLFAVAGVTVAVTAVSATGLAGGVFATYQRSTADALFPSAVTDDRVAVVGVDRVSLAETGVAWPWPRDLQADLVDGIVAAGADAVVVDLVLSPERDGDDALAAALASTESATAVAADVDRSGDIPTGFDLVGPTPELFEAAGRAGHAAMYADPADGVIRSMPLVLEAEDRSIVPALSVAALQALDSATGPVTLRPSGVQVGDRLIPSESGYEMRLNFAEGIGPDADNFTSARDVLAADLDAGAFDGQVVLVGVTEPTLGDQQLVPTAKGGGVSGVFVQAQALNTMLTSSYLTPVGDAETLVAVAVLAAVVAALVLFTPLWVSVPATVFVAALNLAAGFWRFDRGDVVDLVYTSSAVVVAFVAALGVRYLTETRHRRRVAHLFARYVPADVAADLVEDGRFDEASKGERVQITVFFCDLRGFTALSESRPPAVVRDMLSRYYEHVVAAVERHHGTVMQFVGDEVFAIWGAPLHVDDHRDRAFRAAVDAQAAWAPLTAELAETDAPPVFYGIGLNCGEVVAGHVGGGDRLQYTVIGDTVNVGARLCSQAGPGEIVCTDDVLQGVADPPEVADVGPVDMKGVSRDRQLWRVPAPVAQRQAVER